MCSFRFLRSCVFGAVVSLLLLSSIGCGDKQPKQTKASAPQVSKETIPAVDTADVFKEFYSEDSEPVKKENSKKNKVAKPETFSTAASSKTARVSASGEFTPQGQYSVQVSCVRSKAFANAMAAKLKDKGFPAYVSEVNDPTPHLTGTYYRVRIGGFAGLVEAKAFGSKTLSAEGQEYWVDKKANDKVGMEGYGLGTPASGNKPAAESYDYGAPSSTYQAPASSSQTVTPKTESSPYVLPTQTPANAAEIKKTTPETSVPAATPATKSETPAVAPAASPTSQGTSSSKVAAPATVDTSDASGW